MIGISFPSIESSSIVIPFSEYVVRSHFSRIASSLGVSFPSIRCIRLIIFTTAPRRRSHGCASVSFRERGRSNGLIRSFEFRLIFRYVPQTVSASGLYSFSGSSTMTSVPSIRERSISSFTAKDFHPQDFAKTHMFAFSDEKRSKIIRELLCVLIP